jgi:flagellar protein FlbD
MIRVTRLNHAPLVLNSDLIQHLEVTPDTVITLTTGEKLMVLESAQEVIDEVIRFRRSLLGAVLRCPLRMDRTDETPESGSDLA